MKWEGNRESENVEDRRGGRGGGFGVGGASVGIGTVVYALSIGPLVHFLLPIFTVRLETP